MKFASLDRLVGIEENIPLGAVYTAHGGVGDTEELSSGSYICP